MIRNKFTVRLNDEEKTLLIAKANEYGYGDNLSEYIRSASLNESFILEDVVGKDLIFNIVSETLTDIREIMKEIRNMFPKILLREDIEYLKHQQDKIYDSINDLKKTVIDTLSLKYVRKSKQRKIQEDLISELEE